jgi:hypothetical protein
MIDPIAARELANETDAPIYWVAHGPDLSFGVLGPGGHLSTGREVLEQFTRLLQWRRRIIALGGIPDQASLD